jgi:tetratricopeptide (TPR) repeat protein
MAISLTRTGQVDAAISAAEEALRNAQEIKDDVVLGHVLVNAAVVFTENGDIARAIHSILQAVDINRRLGDHYGELVGLSNLGYNYVILGLPDQGIEALERSSQIAESIGALRTNTYNHINLGLAYLRRAEITKAKQVLQETLPVLDGIGDIFARAACYSYLAQAFELAGETTEALDNYRQSKELADQIGVPAYASDSLAGMARCALSSGQLSEALLHACELWDYLIKNGSHGMEFPVWAYLTCAHIFLAANDVERHQMSLKRGFTELMARAEKISDPEWRTAYLNNIPEHREIATQHG